MQDEILDCRQVLGRIEQYLAGEDIAPELEAHLDACDQCLEACLEAALRRPEPVRVPADFPSRITALLPAEYKAPPSVLSYTLVAACVLFAVWGTLTASTGAFAAGARWLEMMLALFVQWVHEPAVPTHIELLLSFVGLETTLSLLWCWRVSRA